MTSGIEQIDVGGRDVTAYVQKIMRERKEPIPHHMRVEVARKVKEQFAYTCPDIEKEFERSNSNPEKFIKKREEIHKKTGQKMSYNIGYERFLAPEVVLNPEMLDSSIKMNLAESVDRAILSCPIDTRRKLYENIMLSGGNTVFKDFGRRLQRDVKRRVQQ